MFFYLSCLLFCQCTWHMVYYQSNLSPDILWMPPASDFCTSRLCVETMACTIVLTTWPLLMTALQLASFLVRSFISFAASEIVLLSPLFCCCSNLAMSGRAFAVSSVDPWMRGEGGREGRSKGERARGGGERGGWSTEEERERR